MLLRVQVTEGKITVNVWRISRGNQFWFELALGSSYQESTVFPYFVKFLESLKNSVEHFF